MNRFRFLCSCGRKLGVYEYMIGKLVTCPNCGKTQPVPTPFQGEEAVMEMEEKAGIGVGKKPTPRGAVVEEAPPTSSSHKLLVTLGIVGGVIVVAVFIYFLLFYQ